MSTRRFDRATLAIAAALAALAAVLAWDASRLQIAAVYGLGPKAAPYAVALFLALLALGHLAAARAAARWPSASRARKSATA